MGEIYGRETELDRVSAVSGHALVLSGEPGIGKTTLWEAGIAAARERGASSSRGRAVPRPSCRSPA
jgi:MoxR-like ATPase